MDSSRYINKNDKSERDEGNNHTSFSTVIAEKLSLFGFESSAERSPPQKESSRLALTSEDQDSDSNTQPNNTTFSTASSLGENLSQLSQVSSEASIAQALSSSESLHNMASSHFDYERAYTSTASELPPIDRASSFAEYADDYSDVYRGIPSGISLAPAPSNTSAFYDTDPSYDFFDKQVKEDNSDSSGGSRGSTWQSTTAKADSLVEAPLRKIPGHRESMLAKYLTTRVPKAVVLSELTGAAGFVTPELLTQHVEKVLSVSSIDILKFNPEKHSWKCEAYVHNLRIVFKVFAWENVGRNDILLEFGLRKGSEWDFRSVIERFNMYYTTTKKSNQSSESTLTNAAATQQKPHPNNHRHHVFAPVTPLETENIGHYLTVLANFSQEEKSAKEDREVMDSIDHYDLQRDVASRITCCVVESPKGSLKKVLDQTKLERLVSLLGKNRHADVQRCIATVIATLCERGDHSVLNSMVAANVIQTLITSAAQAKRSIETRRQCCRALSALIDDHAESLIKVVSAGRKDTQELIAFLESEKDTAIQGYLKKLAPLVLS